MNRQNEKVSFLQESSDEDSVTTAESMDWEKSNKCLSTPHRTTQSRSAVPRIGTSVHRQQGAWGTGIDAGLRPASSDDDIRHFRRRRNFQRSFLQTRPHMQHVPVTKERRNFPATARMPPVQESYYGDYYESYGRAHPFECYTSSEDEYPNSYEESSNSSDDGITCYDWFSTGEAYYEDSECSLPNRFEAIYNFEYRENITAFDDFTPTPNVNEDSVFDGGGEMAHSEDEESVQMYKVIEAGKEQMVFFTGITVAFEQNMRVIIGGGLSEKITTKLITENLKEDGFYVDGEPQIEDGFVLVGLECMADARNLIDRGRIKIEDQWLTTHPCINLNSGH